MKKVTVDVPVLAAMAGTRAMLGVGIGLLISSRVPRERRARLGWALLAVGAASTIPLGWLVLRRH